jgi:hypothetical protein
MYILPFFPLPPSHLMSSATCSNPVFDPNQTTDHLTIIRCTFAHTFKFRDKLFRDHPMTYSSYFWSTLTTYALACAFWGMPPIYVGWFWTLVKTIFTLLIFFLNLLGHLPTSTINSVYKSKPSSNNICKCYSCLLSSLSHHKYILWDHFLILSSY